MTPRAEEPKKEHWHKKVRSELNGLKSMVKMQGLANYLVSVFSDRELDEILAKLADPKLQCGVEINIYFKERAGE